MNREFQKEAIEKYMANISKDIDDLAEKLVISKYVISCVSGIKNTDEYLHDTDKLISDLRSYINKYIYHF